jgi:hypothetical protein
MAKAQAEEREQLKVEQAEQMPARESEKTPQEVSFDELRPQIKAEITSNALEMVRVMIDYAKKGQYQAMKYLFEMIGLYPANADAESTQNEPLAQFLLSRLGISDEANAGSEMVAKADAVE